jgi:hypothetical protein
VITARLVIVVGTWTAEANRPDRRATTALVPSVHVLGMFNRDAVKRSLTFRCESRQEAIGQRVLGVVRSRDDDRLGTTYPSDATIGSEGDEPRELRVGGIWEAHIAVGPQAMRSRRVAADALADISSQYGAWTKPLARRTLRVRCARPAG